MQQPLGPLVELLRRPAALGPGARLDVGAQAPRAGDAAPAELAAQAVVTLKRCIQIAWILSN